MSNTESTYDRVKLILEKSQVKAHTRTSKSGAVANVKTYNDKRTKKEVTNVVSNKKSKQHSIVDEIDNLHGTIEDRFLDVKDVYEEGMYGSGHPNHTDDEFKKVKKAYRELKSVYDKSCNIQEREEGDDTPDSELVKEYRKLEQKSKEICKNLD